MNASFYVRHIVRFISVVNVLVVVGVNVVVMGVSWVLLAGYPSKMARVIAYYNSCSFSGSKS
jgi:hypothetical protein